MTGETRLTQADDLRGQFETALGTGVDWLSRYRNWLDGEGIPAEDNGWPSIEAYDDVNVARFIALWALR